MEKLVRIKLEVTLEEAKLLMMVAKYFDQTIAEYILQFADEDAKTINDEFAIEAEIAVRDLLKTVGD